MVHEQLVARSKEVPYTRLDEKVKRRILAHSAQLMLVEVVMETGGVGTVHTHPHSQNTYVLSGRFRFTMDGREMEVAAGDTLAFLPDVPHGTLCLEAGTLIDVFSPMREDFLK